MNFRIAPALAAAAGMVLSHAAAAHHAFNMYDDSKYVTLNGTVKTFQWANPHANVYFVVSTDSGKTEEWVIECSSPNIIGRKGWQALSLKTGDRVPIVMHPMKDGTKVGLMVSVTTPDGQVLKDKN